MVPSDFTYVISVIGVIDVIGVIQFCKGPPFLLFKKLPFSQIHQKLNHVNHINHMIMYDIFFFEIFIKKEERRGPYKT